MAKKDTIAFKFTVRLLTGGTFTKDELIAEYARNNQDKQPSEHTVTNLIRTIRTDYLGTLNELLWDSSDPTAVMTETNSDEIAPLFELKQEALGGITKYYLAAKSFYMLSFEDVLIILESLMANRFLTEQEIKRMRNRLLSPLLIDKTGSSHPKFDHLPKNVAKLLNDKLKDYKPVQGTPSLAKIEQLQRAILNNERLNISYSSHGHHHASIMVDPLYIFVDKYYMYLFALVDNGEQRIFRVDKIGAEITKSTVPRTSDEQYLKDNAKVSRQHLINANIGRSGEDREITITLRCAGQTAEYVLDQFPTAEITRVKSAQGNLKFTHQLRDLQNDDTVWIEADILSLDGALPWILSQGNRVKVEAPTQLQERVVASLQAALEIYPTQPMP